MQTISEHMALVLKSLRQERGWSLDKTAKETGVSKAMLGQIERAESSPTIATLWKIASGFQRSFSFFLEGADLEEKASFNRSKHSSHLDSADKKMKATALFPYDEQTLSEIFIIELLPSGEQLSIAHEPGVIEHVIVVEGTIEVLLNDVWQIIHAGEGLRFNADTPHGYRNKTTVKASFHNIIHYPKPSHDR
ncbi:MAG: XRE family transcriptional regulator [Legionella sp.]|nr:XRE family transcriptional regulator [Legionella sp.]